MKVENFADTEPKFVLEDYFAGHVEAWGIFEDRFGRLRRSFTVAITGTLNDDGLTLDERFCYADGEKDRRVWHIRRLDEHRFEGRADDIVGTAEGQAYGKALNWRYRLDLPVGGRKIRVSFDDWMFLQEGGVLINRAKVSKFGITLGEVTLFFRKAGDTPGPQAGCGS